MKMFYYKEKKNFCQEKSKTGSFNVSPEQVSFGWLSNVINPMYDSLQTTASI